MSVVDCVRWRGRRIGRSALSTRGSALPAGSRTSALIDLVKWIRCVLSMTNRRGSAGSVTAGSRRSAGAGCHGAIFSDGFVAIVRMMQFSIVESFTTGGPRAFLRTSRPVKNPLIPLCLSRAPAVQAGNLQSSAALPPNPIRRCSARMAGLDRIVLHHKISCMDIDAPVRLPEPTYGLAITSASSGYAACGRAVRPE